MPRIRIGHRQQIILGDCLDVFASERNVPAFVSDPPANIGFMGRSWDKAHPAEDYTPILPPRDKAHLRELQHEHAFVKYWAERYAMAYDIADTHAVNIVWTLPRTSYQTATALRAAGWDIKDNLVHLFGSGWAKTGNALAPGQEGWLLATKGKPNLDINACRVPRGDAIPEFSKGRGAGSVYVQSDDKQSRTGEFRTNGSLPKNAMLSHCEGCVRVGSKRVKASGPACQTGSDTTTTTYGKFNGRSQVTHREPDGTESVPAFHCLAGCVCGARAPWPDDRPLPRCPCGETWRWLCSVAEVNGQSGVTLSQGAGKRSQSGFFGTKTQHDMVLGFGDIGGAARFFNTFRYLSKCSPSERHAGCEKLFWRADKKDPFGFVQVTREEWETLPNDQRAQGNVHPTVKSYRLMHWHHSLTGAPRILDLTAGSGTGMYTAHLDGIEWLGAEICPQAITIAEARYAWWSSLSADLIASFKSDKSLSSIIKTREKSIA